MKTPPKSHNPPRHKLHKTETAGPMTCGFFNTSSGKTVRVRLGVRVRLTKSLLLREKVAARLGKANVALTDEEFSTQRNLHLIHHATFRYAEVGMVPLPPLGKACS